VPAAAYEAQTAFCVAIRSDIRLTAVRLVLVNLFEDTEARAAKPHHWDCVCSPRSRLDKRQGDEASQALGPFQREPEPESP